MYNDFMAYRVFLVEDEIVTREGIRDNVDWAAAGFEFCGEATDGETALQLIEDSKPDVIITDIKMPFMDGLQLSKVVRENMPWIKIIILSGHDEFEYAQSAVKLGVTEYLLKPISAQGLHNVLLRVAKTLEKEQLELKQLKRMQTQLQDSLVLTREKFLLDLLMGVYSPAEAIEQSQQLGLDILAKYYLIAMFEINLCQDASKFEYQQYHNIERIVSEFASNNLDIFLTKKDFEELVLFIKGEDKEQLQSEGKFITQVIKNEIEKQIDCQVNLKFGTVQDRLGFVHVSFLDALFSEESRALQTSESTVPDGLIEPVTLDHDAITNFFKFGAPNEFEAFFDQVLRPIGELALDSPLMMQYLFVDLVLKAAEIKNNYDRSGQDLDHNIDEIISRIHNLADLRTESRRIIVDVIKLRNQQISPERAKLIQQTRRYLEENLSNPDLKLRDLAENFSLSPNYFSAIFRKEMGETFKDVLTNLRINLAKELLRTTNLRVSEIADQSGFNDAHYFSHVFKRLTGFTPTKFRQESQVGTFEE